MDIPKNALAAIVVDREWTNLKGVRIFLKRYQEAATETKGLESPHLILARIVDSEDRHGLWVELFCEKGRDVKPLTLMIPWSKITAVALTEDWTPALQEEMRQIGFLGKT